VIGPSLDVPVSFFFDDMDPVRAPAILAGFAEPAAEAFDDDPRRRRETVELVSAYYRIDDPALRRRSRTAGGKIGQERSNQSIFSVRLSRVGDVKPAARPGKPVRGTMHFSRPVAV
jgi:hypothetical protein